MWLPAAHPPLGKNSAGLKSVFGQTNAQVFCDRRPSICFQYRIKLILVPGQVLTSMEASKTGKGAFSLRGRLVTVHILLQDCISAGI